MGPTLDVAHENEGWQRTEGGSSSTRMEARIHCLFWFDFLGGALGLASTKNREKGFVGRIFAEMVIPCRALLHRIQLQENLWIRDNREAALKWKRLQTVSFTDLEDDHQGSIFSTQGWHQSAASALSECRVKSYTP